MSSCIHFLSSTKPNTTWKKCQETRTEGQLVVVKSKSACMVSRNLSAKQVSSLESGASHSSGSQELGQNSVFASAGRPVRDRVQSSPSSSQEWQRDENPLSSAGRPVRGVCVCESVQAQGDLREGSRTNLQGRSWTTTRCKSPAKDTLRKSSRMFDKS